jgi:hypothetical protein
MYNGKQRNFIKFALKLLELKSGRISTLANDLLSKFTSLLKNEARVGGNTQTLFIIYQFVVKQKQQQRKNKIKKETQCKTLIRLCASF